MVQSAQLLSVAIGPAVGGYVASHFGIRYAFFVDGGHVRGGADRARSCSSRRSQRRRRAPRGDARGAASAPADPSLSALPGGGGAALRRAVPRPRAVAPDSAPGRAHARPRDGRGHRRATIISIGAIAATASANVAARLARDVPVRAAPPDRIARRRTALRGHGPGPRLASRCSCCARSPGSVSARRSRSTYSLGRRHRARREHRGAAFGWLAPRAAGGHRGQPAGDRRDRRGQPSRRVRLRRRARVGGGRCSSPSGRPPPRRCARAGRSVTRSGGGASRGRRPRLRGSRRWRARDRPAPAPAASRERAWSAMVALICCFTACTAEGLLAAISSAVSSAHGHEPLGGRPRG